MYAATISRPDIAHAAGLLARYSSNWNKDHLQAAKHLLRYLRGTSELCLTFDATLTKRTILSYADANWGGCLDTEQTATGFLPDIWWPCCLEVLTTVDDLVNR